MTAKGATRRTDANAGGESGPRSPPPDSRGRSRLVAEQGQDQGVMPFSTEKIIAARCLFEEEEL